LCQRLITLGTTRDDQCNPRILAMDLQVDSVACGERSVRPRINVAKASGKFLRAMRNFYRDATATPNV